jgi:hypothetical protein
MARLHGQCEIHCYVEAENRLWLANIIESGLEKGIYRKNLDWGDLGLEDLGWNSVITLLGNGCRSPVVTSYSVCDTFPNPCVANFKVIEEGSCKDWDKLSELREAWYNLSKDKQWELAIAGLRERIGIELKPENWDDYYFSHGWDAVKINQLFTIPREKWSLVARVFDQTQLRAPEAWEYAMSMVK